MRKIFKDKQFIKTMIALAIPITLQSLITSSLNLVDNIMIGKLGEAAIAAVGLANQYFFVFTLCIMGVNAGANIFMAQFWGKKDIRNIKKMLGIDISVGFIATFIFGALAFFFPKVIMSVLSKDSSVIALGSEYLRIVALGTICINITQGYSSALKSTEQPSLPMFASLIGVLSNAFLNWVFIFGNLGFDAMGVKGAAIATTLARIIEMMFIVVAVYAKKNIVAGKLNELINFNMNDIKGYFNVSTSVILNELVWSLGMTAYTVSYSYIGTGAVATMQIANTLNNMVRVLCTGLGVSAAIMVGNKIGADQEDVAIDYSKKIGIVAPSLGIILGIIIWFTAPLVVKPFNVTAATYADTIKILKIMAIFSTLRFFNVVMIIGVFRGGGDTLFTMLVQLGTVWFYAVPIAFIGAIVFKLSVEAVFFLICTEELVKLFFTVPRLKSCKWIRNVINS